MLVPYKDDNGKPFKLLAPFYTSGLFFQMKTKKGEDGVKRHYVMIKDDTIPNEPKNLEIPVENLFNTFQEKQDMRLYDYFQAQIRLCATICLSRAYKAILFLENIFTQE